MINIFIKKIHIILLVFIIGINVVFFGLLIASNFYPSLIKINDINKVLKISAYFILFFLNFLGSIYYAFFIIKPFLELNVVKEKMKILSKDFFSLTMVISELSRGNMIIQASFTSELIKIKKYFKSSELTKQYNQLFNFLKDTILDFNSITAVPCNRLIYVGADSFREGEKCGEAMGLLLKGKGEVAVLLKKNTVISHLLRFKGFQSVINKKHLNIHILGVWEEFENVEETYRITKELAKKYPNLSGIYVCEGTTPVGAARAINELNISDKIKIVTHDLANPTMENLIKGNINATLSQNPYVQGYNPVIILYNYLVTKKEPPVNRLLTLLEIVNKENYKELWSAEHGALVSKKTEQSLIIPVENTTSKKFKIAVIIPDDKLFWIPIVNGVKDASIKLKEYSTEVKYIIPKELQSGDWSTETFIPIIESIIKSGIDALSLPIFDKNLIPFLNTKIADGLIVATYNSEPASFRGMLDNVAKHADNLLKVSETLAAGSNESNNATNQINKSMKNILAGTKTQLEKLSETEKSMNYFMDNINKISLESSETSKAANNAIKKAQIGYETVQKNREVTQKLIKSSKIATNIINVLNDDTKKIKKIINIIEEITSQTGVLAINAAIQAAHAGNEGKGFSVVATEIRDLANKSTLATKDIHKLIETILSGVENAINSMTESILEVDKNAKMSYEIEEALVDILQAASDNESKTQVIDQAVKEIKKVVDDFKESMNSLVILNRNNTHAIEEITQSTEDMNLQVQELSKMANLLSDMSKSQEDLISQFIIEETNKE